MREIKFRAWDKLSNRMFDVIMIDWQQGILHGLYDNHSDWEKTRERADRILAIAQTELVEYTGLKDKNGKEIYEGDKLQFAAEDEGNIWVEVVKWSKEMLSWCLYDDKDDAEPLEPLSDQAGADMEVIGNIYSNPELLETK